MKTEPLFTSAAIGGSCSYVIVSQAIKYGFAHVPHKLNSYDLEFIQQPYSWQTVRHALSSAVLYENLQIFGYPDFPFHKSLVESGFRYVQPTEPAKILAAGAEGIPLLTTRQLRIAHLLKHPLQRYWYKRARLTLANYTNYLNLMADADWLDSLAHSRNREAREMLGSAVLFSRGLVPTLDMFDRAAHAGWGCITDEIATYPITRSNKSGSMPDRNDLIAAYAILLEEVPSFPCPRTLSEAIDMRSDTRIQDLRIHLRRWAVALQEGHFDKERRVRSEIKRIVRRAGSLKNWKYIGGISVYLSLPTAFTLFLSIPLALLGTVVQSYVDYTEHRYRWINWRV